jgi:hypothetical protein
LIDRLSASNIVQNSQKMEILSNTAFSDYHNKLIPYVKNRSLEQNMRVSSMGVQNSEAMLINPMDRNGKKDDITIKIDQYIMGKINGGGQPQRLPPQYEKPKEKEKEKVNDKDKPKKPTKQKKSDSVDSKKVADESKLYLKDPDESAYLAAEKFGRFANSPRHYPHGNDFYPQFR